MKYKHKLQTFISEEDQLPVYWIVKETYFLGINWCYELIGQDGKDSIPFQCIENLEYYLQLKQIKLC